MGISNVIARVFNPPESFTPTFVDASQLFVTAPDGSKTYLNPNYYATTQTADWIAQRYGHGAAKIVSVMPAGYNGPYFFASDAAKAQLWVEFPAGIPARDNYNNAFSTARPVKMIAGELAAFYARNPFSLADQFVLQAIGQAATITA